MAQDLTSKMLVTQEALRQRDDFMKSVGSSIEPASAALKALGSNPGLRRLILDLDRHRDVMRAALGPLEELRRNGMFDRLSGLAGEVAHTQQALADYHAQFQLPQVVEVARLLKQFEESSVVAQIRRFSEQAGEIQRAMEAMGTPWLDMQNRLQSFGGFAELQSIGLAMQQLPTFGERLADQLRAGLGDWQQTISWPETIFSDMLARTAFYADRGLNSRLTDFPAEAFRQSAAIAGLTGEPPPLIELYRGESAEHEEEAGFERTNAAHDRLQRFETQLRNFINDKMTAAFGEGWIKGRVPGEIHQRWRDKRDAAREKGEREWPLLAYADFTDYVPIMTRNDNWTAVFKPVFRRVEFVTESFQRLYPIRICTMHARLITQDDELYLYVETKRVLAAIGIVV